MPSSVPRHSARSDRSGRSAVPRTREACYRASMKSSFAFLLLLLGGSATFGDSYQSLFIIERSTNANVIHYDAKVATDGAIDSREPVIAYWVMLGEDGRREEFNALEKNLAYGFTIRHDKASNAYWMTLVSQKERPIHIFQQEGKVFAVTRIGGRDAYLRKIYVKTRKSGLFRTADYFELFGQDLVTKQDCQEKVVPKK